MRIKGGVLLLEWTKGNLGVEYWILPFEYIELVLWFFKSKKLRETILNYLTIILEILFNNNFLSVLISNQLN